MFRNLHATLIEGATTLPTAARRLRIIDGTAWFSQGSEDVILKTGDEINLNGREKAVLSVLSRGRVTYQLVDSITS